MVAPVHEVGAEREPDPPIGPGATGHRTVEQRVAIAEPVREERSILVRRRQQDAAADVLAEVAGDNEKDQRAVGRISRAHDEEVVTDLRHPGVLEPPPLGMHGRVGQQRAVGLDRPAAEPVGAPGDAEVRDAAPVLDAHEQHGLARRAPRPPG